MSHKPREYWVDSNPHKDDYGDVFYSTLDEKPPCGPMLDRSIHVIEYSAYEALQVELEELKDGYQGACYACEPVAEQNETLKTKVQSYEKALEFVKTNVEVNGLKVLVGNLHNIATVAREALAQHREGK